MLLYKKYDIYSMQCIDKFVIKFSYWEKLPYVFYYNIGIGVNFINKSRIRHYFGTGLWIGWV